MFQHVWEYQLELNEHFQATFLTESLAAVLPFCPTPLLAALAFSFTSLPLLLRLVDFSLRLCQKGKEKRADNSQSSTPFTQQSPRGDDCQKTKHAQTTYPYF